MMPISSTGRRSRTQHGYSYVMILVAVTVMTISAQVATYLVSRTIKTEKEKQLLFRGQAYSRAIASYYNAVPNAPAYPRFLSELENDSRFLHKRHIRRLYDEPITGSWKLIRNRIGGIVGVVSPSSDAPAKVDNFPAELEYFAGANQYNEWQFVFDPGEKK